MKKRLGQKHKIEEKIVGFPIKIEEKILSFLMEFEEKITLSIVEEKISCFCDIGLKLFQYP